jgi:hypothetical protein
VWEARELTDRAMALAEREQRKDTAAFYQGWQALAEALFGSSIEAQKRATAALKLSSTKYVIILAAAAGERARTQALIADLSKRYRTQVAKGRGVSRKRLCPEFADLTSFFQIPDNDIGIPRLDEELLAFAHPLAQFVRLGDVLGGQPEL